MGNEWVKVTYFIFHNSIHTNKKLSLHASHQSFSHEVIFRHWYGKFWVTNLIVLQNNVMLTTNCQTIFEVSVLISELSNLSSEIIFYAFNPCFMNLQNLSCFLASEIPSNISSVLRILQWLWQNYKLTCSKAFFLWLSVLFFRRTWLLWRILFFIL